MFRKKFGQIAVKKGLATEDKLQEALAKQKDRQDKGLRHEKIGEILQGMGLITKEQIESILEEQKKFFLANWIYSIFHIHR
ncbi:MAG: hypothetical protein ABIH01_04380 [Candidatus Omnitrophota bacterium]